MKEQGNQQRRIVHELLDLGSHGSLTISVLDKNIEWRHCLMTRAMMYEHSMLQLFC